MQDVQLDCLGGSMFAGSIFLLSVFGGHYEGTGAYRHVERVASHDLHIISNVVSDFVNMSITYLMHVRRRKQPRIDQRISSLDDQLRASESNKIRGAQLPLSKSILRVQRNERDNFPKHSR